MAVTLAERMKRYEQALSPHLTRRVPVIVRVDGRAFHGLRLDKPFDHRFMESMVEATRTVQSNMQGCRIAYTQSDEATFVLTDTRRLDTEPWFGYDMQKVVSIAAAAMTSAFNGDFHLASRAHFDARAFNLPEDEVANCLLWRARDWMRNSVQMMACARFSPRQLHGKKVPDMLAMLGDAGDPWEARSDAERHGVFVVDGEGVALPEISYAAIAPLVERALEREES